MKTEVRLELDRRAVFAEGRPFGEAGAYERLTGRVRFALDPADASNANVVDLDYAPRNDRGLVEFSGGVDIMKPVDLARGSQRVLYDVNNRGNRTALGSLNDAPRSSDPLSVADAGNGFLMRQGHTVVWSGWQGDLVPGGGMLVADLPEARRDGQPLSGVVRQEFIADEAGVFCMPLSGAPVIRSYPVTDQGSATLTVRERETDPRQPVERGTWSFSEAPVKGGGVAVPSDTHLYMADGFKPGWIYELIYETQGSQVMGLGIVGIRDLVSFLRYDESDADGQPNPLAGHVERAYTYGQSLSARVIRQFVYDGYNADPLGRRVFDAVFSHVSGGGRLFANSRFAQVGRYPRQHEEHQWPSERYPFAYAPVPDPFTEGVDSVLQRPESDPLVMHTHTNTEYWLRHASLGHTDPRNGDDLEVPEGVRMYALASAQHMGARPMESDAGSAPGNLMSTGPVLRAALVLMDRWATDGTPPPPSRLPSRSDGTLASPEDVLPHVPSIPGAKLPDGPSRLPRYDYGPEFDQGIVEKHPPEPIAGQEYPVQVPEVDADGNDVGGLRLPEIEAPVGTHRGWNVRREGFAAGDLFSLSGSFISFARTKAERTASGDPRLSIEERYATHEDYVQAVARAARALVEVGLLLAEDEARYVRAARARNPLDPGVPLAPLSLDVD